MNLPQRGRLTESWQILPEIASRYWQCKGLCGIAEREIVQLQADLYAEIKAADRDVQGLMASILPLPVTVADFGNAFAATVLQIPGQDKTLLPIKKQPLGRVVLFPVTGKTDPYPPVSPILMELGNIATACAVPCGEPVAPLTCS